jgi:hypothetical protein
MKMKMGIEQLVPGMQNGNKAQLATESVLGISAKDTQGFRYRFKENIKHNRFIG